MGPARAAPGGGAAGSANPSGGGGATQRRRRRGSGRRRRGQAAAVWRWVSVSELGQPWCARKSGAGWCRGGSRRTAATSTAAGGGKAWNEHGNLANAEERGEHDHQWLT